MELRAVLTTHRSFPSEHLCLAALLQHVAGTALLVSATVDISSKPQWASIAVNYISP